MQRLQNKFAIITGASGGLGQAFCKAFLAEGATVVAADLKEDFEADYSKSDNFLFVKTDISNAESVTKLLEKTIKTFKKIDILVNNAAFLPAPKPFETISETEWDLTFSVNVKGYWLCSKAVVPQMRAQGFGRIINLSSSTFWEGVAMILPYISSKAAIIGFTRALARELSNTGITVNAIAPGLTMTTQNQAQFQEEGILKAIQAKVIQNRIIQRSQMPEDLTGALIFLASEESRFISGQTWLIDGGGSFG